MHVWAVELRREGVRYLFVFDAYETAIYFADGGSRNLGWEILAIWEL